MAANGLSLSFLGAAQTVTGSMHLIEFAGRRILLDCGLMQGKRKEAFDHNRHPAVPPESVDAILLSHAHMDHSGNLPTFEKLGFRGKIYCTPATRDLCEVLLRDSANVQVRQVELVNRQRKEMGKNPFEPLYDEGDVERVMSRFQEVPYDQPVQAAADFTVSFRNSGHILGSALVQMDFGPDAARKRLLFTGDLGRPGQVILKDPAPVEGPDYVISESTYGDRAHPTGDVIKTKLREVITTVSRRRSRLIIPAFSIGRTQMLIYYLHQLHDEGRIPALPIYIDSPLARKATDVFRKHTECYDEEANAFLLAGEEPFSFNTLRYVESVGESKKLNNQRGPFIVMSASGMCEGGRVLHHLAHGIGDAANVILLTGFQAIDTLGRKLQEGRSPVNILGESYPVRARIEMMQELSAHADASEICDYFTACHAAPRNAFLVHGEPAQAEQLRKELQARLAWPDVRIPAPGDKIELA